MGTKPQAATVASAAAVWERKQALFQAGFSAEVVSLWDWLWARANFTEGEVSFALGDVVVFLRTAKTTAKRWVDALKDAHLLELESARIGRRGGYTGYVCDPLKVLARTVHRVAPPPDAGQGELFDAEEPEAEPDPPMEPPPTVRFPGADPAEDERPLPPAAEENVPFEERKMERFNATDENVPFDDRQMERFSMLPDELLCGFRSKLGDDWLGLWLARCEIAVAGDEVQITCPAGLTFDHVAKQRIAMARVSDFCGYRLSLEAETSPKRNVPFEERKMERSAQQEEVSSSSPSSPKPPSRGLGEEEGEEDSRSRPPPKRSAPLLAKAGEIYEAIEGEKPYKWVAITAAVALESGALTTDDLAVLIRAPPFAKSLKEKLRAGWMTPGKLRPLLAARGIAWQDRWTEKPET